MTDTGKSLLDIGVCIFAYNEENNILLTLDSVTHDNNHCGLISEICVIDDGSRDRTPELVIEHARGNSSIRLLRHKRNLGPTEALRTALGAMQCSYILLLPGDYTYDSQAVKDVLELRQLTPLETPLVLGIRTQSRARRSLSREMAAWLARLPLQVLNQNPEKLPNVGLILFQRSMALKLPTGVKGYGQGVGLLGTLLIAGASFSAIPVDQVRGSELRGSKLTATKVLDVMETYVSLWRSRGTIRGSRYQA